MAGVDDDVTLGEIARRFDRFESNIGGQLRDMAQNSISAAVWAVEKRALEERDQAQGRERADLRGKLTATEQAKKLEHDAIDQKIAAVRSESAEAVQGLQTRLDARDEAVRKERAQRNLAIGLAVLAAILGIISTVTSASISSALSGITG